MSIEWFEYRKTHRFPYFIFLSLAVLTCTFLFACTPGYLQGVYADASCPYAVRMAIQDGDKGTEALLAALKKPEASEYAVDALFYIAKDDSEHTADENERALRIY